jgi:hypothetical protein
MRVGLYRSEIVDADDLDIAAARFHDRAQHVAPNAAESIDAHTN